MLSFIKNIFKETLHKACDKGNIEAVKQFLADGADVNVKDKDGGTPLSYAAFEGHKEIAELLIEKGADVNATGESGRTPLHNAGSWNKETIELLIAKGADVNAEVVSKTRYNGRTPLDEAIVDNETEVAALLRKHGGKTKKELEAGN